MKNFWISWNAPRGQVFELLSPWWISGTYSGGVTICAAVKAATPAEAKAPIYAAYEIHPGSLRFRFVSEKPDGWAPWDAAEGETSRFQRDEWMVWS